MRLKVYNILLLFILAYGPVLAQYDLQGILMDSSSNNPIEDAEIYNYQLNRIEKTNSNGEFIFKNLKKGNYRLTVFKLGYQVKAITIKLESTTSIDLSIATLNTELSEVLISEKRDEIFAIRRLEPVEGTQIYAGKKSEVVELQNFVGNSASNNARQIYSQVVGLNIYEGNDAGLQLNVGGRGLDPNRSSNFNTRQNGYDISADVLGYPESYYTPPADALDEIRIIRGASSLQYGTQFGGLIDFRMKKPNEDKGLEFISRNTLGSFGLFNTYNSLSGKKGKVSYYTYLNYKQGNGYRDNSDFNSINYFGHINFQLNKKTNIEFEYTYLNYLAQQAGGLTDTQFEENPIASNRDRNWFEVNWNLYSLKFIHKISYRTTLSLNVFGLQAQRNAIGFRGDPIRPIRNPITEIDDPSFERDLIKGEFNNWGAEFRSISRYQALGKDAVFLIGAKYYQSNNFSIQGAGSNGSDSDFNFDPSFPSYPNQSDFRFPNLNLALFTENIFYLNPKLSITPGLRFEYIKTESIGDYLIINYDRAGNEIFRKDTSDNRVFERKILLAGLGISYYQSSNFEFYGNFSQNYRSVTFSDIRVVNPTFIIDPNISDERGFTSDFGIRGKWASQLSYDVGAFAIYYKDRIGTTLVQDGPNKGDRVRKNVGDAVIYGFEFFADWNMLKTFKLNTDRFRINPFINSALTGSQYIRSDENNIVDKKVEFIPLFNLKSGLRLTYDKFNANFQYTVLSEQFTDAENTAIPESGDSREGIIGEIPSYSVFDISISYTINRFKFETGLNNALNNSYFTRRATGYPGPDIIPADGRSYYFTIQLEI